MPEAGRSLAAWLVLGTAGLVVAGPAEASAGSVALESLAEAVAARAMESTAQQRALARAARLLEGASGDVSGATGDLAGDLRIAARVGLVLDRAFPGDGEFQGLLEAARTAFRDEVGGHRDSFAGLAEALGDSAPGRRVARELPRADALLAEADSHEEPTPALRALAGAMRAIERGRKSVSIEGDSWLVAFIDGRPFLSTLFASGDDNETTFRVDGYSSRSWLDVAKDRVRIITLYVEATEPGTYQLVALNGPSPYGGEVAFANPLCVGRYGCGTYRGDGWLTIDSIGPISEGSFEFVADDSLGPIVVSGGRFRVRTL